MANRDCEWALSWHVDDFRCVVGSDLFGRLEMFQAWVDRRRALRVWPADNPRRISHNAERNDGRLTGLRCARLDFERMDPLGLLSKRGGSAVVPAAVDPEESESCEQHEHGQSVAAADRFTSALGELVGSPHLIPTTHGWDATPRAIRGLVRPLDHILIDACCDDETLCNAMAATRQIHVHAHLDVGDVRRRLAWIRSRDRDNAILIVTSSLFATTSRLPDLEALRDAARGFSAFLLVDASNDFGVALRRDLDWADSRTAFNQADVVTANLAPTLTADIGFISCRVQAAATYLRWFPANSRAQVGVSAKQAANALAALRMIRSPEGRVRRERLAENIRRLRSSLQESGVTPLGVPSWIASIAIERDDVARLAFRRAKMLGASVELIESGNAVRSSGARLRLYISSEHDPRQLTAIGSVLAQAIQEARYESAQLSAAPYLGGRRASDDPYVDV